MAAGVVVSRVLLPCDQLLGMEQLAVSSSPHLVHHRWLQVDKYCPWHMLPGIRLREEGVEGVVSLPDGGVAGHHPIGLDAMLEAVELPAGVSHLGAGLADVDRDAFPHGGG